jgi:hypothetical protein
MWYRGEIGRILDFVDTNDYQAFDDAPWWLPGMFRIIASRFPQSGFVMLKRPAEDWFRSMKMHSDGRLLGNPIHHASIYQRSDMLIDLAETHNVSPTSALMKDQLLSANREAYIRYHLNYHSEVISWFKFNGLDHRLYTGNLYGLDWREIASFLGVLSEDSPDTFSEHASNQSVRLKYQQ